MSTGGFCGQRPTAASSFASLVEQMPAGSFKIAQNPRGLSEVSGLSAFVPLVGDSGLELRFTYGTTNVEASLARLEERAEPKASDNVTLLWHTAGAGRHTDIWADGALVFAPRFDGKIEILDASSGEILGIASLPEGNEGEPNIAFDVKARNGRLYVASRLSGLVVFDVSQPAEPLLIGQYRVFDGEGSPENFTDIHNIFLSPNGDMLYAANTSFPLDSLSGRQTDLRPDLRVIDVSDPSSPEELARFAKVGNGGKRTRYQRDPLGRTAWWPSSTTGKRVCGFWTLRTPMLSR